MRDVTSTAEELPESMGPVEYSQERGGPEKKSYQQDKHEMINDTSRMTGVDTVLRGDEAPVSESSGCTADATEASSVVPIDPKLLEDYQVRFHGVMSFNLFKTDEAAVN